MTTADRLMELEKQSKEDSKEIKDLALKLEGMAQFTQQSVAKIQGVEQSATSLAKTFAAVTKVLIKRSIIDDAEVMRTMMESEESETRKQINGLVKSGILVKDDSVKPDSVLIIKQVLTEIKGDEVHQELISRYSVLELSRQDIPQHIKDDFNGKVVNETYSFTDRPETLTIMEIYKAVEITGPAGETSPSRETPEKTTEPGDEESPSND